MPNGFTEPVINVIKDIYPLGLRGKSEDEWLEIHREIENKFKPETGSANEYAHFWFKRIKEAKLNKVSREAKISDSV
jgi:hypothetical protein